MIDTYLYEQRSVVEEALSRETAAWSRDEDGVALLEAYHAHQQTEQWDDFALFPVEDGDLRDWVRLAIEWDDGQLLGLDTFRCAQCGHEELCSTHLYDEDPALSSAEAWQILVPEGESPRGPGAIVHCPECTVAR